MDEFFKSKNQYCNSGWWNNSGQKKPKAPCGTNFDNESAMKAVVESTYGLSKIQVQ
jgi:hypothetical protein